MSLWKQHATPDDINRLCRGTMCEFVGIVITEIGDDYVRGTMPVDERTRQHMGIVHGGASVVLAETLGSVAAGLCVPVGARSVGLDINANHLRAGKPPLLTGIARPVHVGNTTSVWEIRITDVDDKLVCVSRLTCAVLQER
ncbi:MAG: hotdog fold thioesterase [Pseudohongiellaceae bacterium]|jgi:1,4-dihydroxy-2-naphthoyl-CoA hydrolase